MSARGQHARRPSWQESQSHRRAAAPPPPKVAHFPPRKWHAACRTSRYIFAIGGVGEHDGYLADVWRSDDGGQLWQLACSSAPFGPRAMHSAVSLRDGTIYVIGGTVCNGSHAAALASDVTCNDVWRSADQGVTWDCVNEHARWARRCYHSSVVDGAGAMYVIGGTAGTAEEDEDFADVWRSADEGKSWAAVCRDAPFGARSAHTSVAIGDDIFLVGGYREKQLLEDDATAHGTGDAAAATPVGAAARAPPRCDERQLLLKQDMQNAAAYHVGKRVERMGVKRNLSGVVTSVEMIQMVDIEEGQTAGTIIVITTPWGDEIEAVVPHGKDAGDEFELRIALPRDFKPDDDGDDQPGTITVLVDAPDASKAEDVTADVWVSHTRGASWERLATNPFEARAFHAMLACSSGSELDGSVRDGPAQASSGPDAADGRGSSDLVLDVLSAAGLAKADTFGKSDPFCVVTWCGAKCHTTEVIKKTLDPVWSNETVNLAFPKRGEAKLCVDCFDWDAIGTNDFLGQVLLSERDINSLSSSGQARAFPLQKCSLKASSLVQGELTLRLRPRFAVKTEAKFGTRTSSPGQAQGEGATEDVLFVLAGTSASSFSNSSHVFADVWCSKATPSAPIGAEWKRVAGFDEHEEIEGATERPAFGAVMSAAACSRPAADGSNTLELFMLGGARADGVATSSVFSSTDRGKTWTVPRAAENARAKVAAAAAARKLARETRLQEEPWALLLYDRRSDARQHDHGEHGHGPHGSPAAAFVFRLDTLEDVVLDDDEDDGEQVFEVAAFVKDRDDVEPLSGLCAAVSLGQGKALLLSDTSTYRIARTGAGDLHTVMLDNGGGAGGQRWGSSLRAAVFVGNGEVLALGGLQAGHEKGDLRDDHRSHDRAEPGSHPAR